MSGRFEGRSVLISGGARGMGAAEARLLAAEGALVVIGDVLHAEGEAVAAEIGAACRYVPLDVTREANWARAVAAAEALAPLHGLVNNAGIYVRGNLSQTEPHDFEASMRVNQLGTFLGMRAAAPAMERAGSGSMVNISSSAGLRGSPFSLAYASTKWAIRGMTKSVAIDLGPKNIRVNSVHPGPIDTDMLRIRSAADLEARRMSVPLRRLGDVMEVARLVAFLLSDDSSYMTGAELAIDGGVTL